MDRDGYEQLERIEDKINYLTDVVYLIGKKLGLEEEKDEEEDIEDEIEESENQGENKEYEQK